MKLLAGPSTKGLQCERTWPKNPSCMRTAHRKASMMRQAQLIFCSPKQGFQAKAQRECHTCKAVVHASCQDLSWIPGMPLQTPNPTPCAHLQGAPGHCLEAQSLQFHCETYAPKAMQRHADAANPTVHSQSNVATELLCTEHRCNFSLEWWLKPGNSNGSMHKGRQSRSSR